MDQRPGGSPVSSKALPAVLVLLLVVGLAALANHFLGDPPATNAPKKAATLSPPPAATATPPRAATGRVARSQGSIPKANVSNEHKLELPDGTLVDALNGAVDAPPLKDYWGTFEWSPIIGIERSSAGVDWYKHADGSYSTTEMVMRTDLGRKAAMTRVAHPGPAPATTAPNTKTTSPR